MPPPIIPYNISFYVNIVLHLQFLHLKVVPSFIKGVRLGQRAISVHRGDKISPEHSGKHESPEFSK